MRRYIVLLLITGIVWAQTDFDKLVLKDGTTYLGEYEKIEGKIVYFKPQNAFAFQPISVKQIERLELKDGRVAVLDSKVKSLTLEEYQKLSTKEKAIYDEEKGQTLLFKNNDETIKIETGEKLQLNEDKYTLVKTDYSKQYVIVKKHNTQIQDTLRFDSVVSFKYYEKSFGRSVLKGTAYGALFGAANGVIDGEMFHIMVFSIWFGGIGSIGGAIYGILNPIASEQIILDKEGWYISN
jgi:hypothetical protein